MIIGLYQFAVSGDVRRNFTHMEAGIRLAAAQNVRLLAFPECALTGYPPLQVASPAAIDFDAVRDCTEALHALAREHNLYLVFGSVTRGDGCCHNSAVVLAPDGSTMTPYHKRALWGWDRDHFCPGNGGGVYEIDGLRIGVRICFEVRFPEYFRELYRARTDFNLVLFCDVAQQPDPERYALIGAHLRTRAVENVCAVCAVNCTAPYQTAPSAVFDSAGSAVCELVPGVESLLVYRHERTPPSFGAQGRLFVSDRLTQTPPAHQPR